MTSAGAAAGRDCLYLVTSRRRAVAILDMPHVRSAAALLSRQRRAAERGFLRATPASDSRFVLVPAPLHGRVKRMTKSLVIHQTRDEQNGFSSHYARNASLAAARAGAIPRDVLGSDLKTHSAANAAKHVCSRVHPGRVRWADDSEEEGRAAVPCVSAESGTLSFATSSSPASCGPPSTPASEWDPLLKELRTLSASILDLTVSLPAMLNFGAAARCSPRLGDAEAPSPSVLCEAQNEVKLDDETLNFIPEKLKDLVTGKPERCDAETRCDLSEEEVPCHALLDLTSLTHRVEALERTGSDNAAARCLALLKPGLSELFEQAFELNNAAVGQTIKDLIPMALSPLARRVGEHGAASLLEGATSDDVRAVEVGARVMLCGLRAAARNGAMGTVSSVDDERAGVLVDGDDKPIAVKYDNLLLMGCGPPPLAASRSRSGFLDVGPD